MNDEVMTMWRRPPVLYSFPRDDFVPLLVYYRKGMANVMASFVQMIWVRWVP